MAWETAPCSSGRSRNRSSRRAFQGADQLAQLRKIKPERRNLERSSGSLHAARSPLTIAFPRPGRSLLVLAGTEPGCAALCPVLSPLPWPAWKRSPLVAMGLVSTAAAWAGRRALEYVQQKPIPATSPFARAVAVLRGLPLLTASMRFQQPASSLRPAVERQRDRVRWMLPLATATFGDSCVCDSAAPRRSIRVEGFERLVLDAEFFGAIDARGTRRGFSRRMPRAGSPRAVAVLEVISNKGQPTLGCTGSPGRGRHIEAAASGSGAIGVPVIGNLVESKASSRGQGPGSCIGVRSPQPAPGCGHGLLWGDGKASGSNSGLA